MSNEVLRIATRQSPLALWQAEYVRSHLERLHPDLKIELLPMTTRGDQIVDRSLVKVGGKGLFIKELEYAMLEGRADIAVHSMKDVPMEFPEGLGLAVICEREDVRDAFVSNYYATFDDLPEGARVGSSSLRRQSQLKALRPDLTVVDLRGNVNTRLRKLDDGDFDAIILASAGLKRLGMPERITQALDTSVCLPAGGQGAVGIECRLEDDRMLSLLRPLGHDDSAICVTAERAMNARLNGGCQVPIACLAELDGDLLHVRGIVGDPDCGLLLRSDATGRADAAEALGVRVAENLLHQGAADILAKVPTT